MVVAGWQDDLLVPHLRCGVLYQHCTREYYGAYPFLLVESEKSLKEGTRSEYFFIYLEKNCSSSEVGLGLAFFCLIMAAFCVPRLHVCVSVSC